MIFKLSPKLAWKLHQFGLKFHGHGSTWGLRRVMRIDRIRWWWEGVGDRIMGFAMRTPEVEIALELDECWDYCDDDDPCQTNTGREIRARRAEFEPVLETLGIKKGGAT